MVWDQIIIQYIYEHPEIISGAAASVGLALTAAALRHQQKQAQFKMAESIFKDLRQLEKELSDIEAPSDTYTDSEYLVAVKDWDLRFFNTLEWFAFLINENEIRSEKLVSFFKPAIIKWKEQLFDMHLPQTERDDPTRWREIKKLYNQINPESSTSIFHMKHESG